MVLLSTGILDKNRPRYLMGVGVAIDLVVCVALGVDMFDCVFPTRTAVCISHCIKSYNYCVMLQSHCNDFNISEIWLCFNKFWTIEFEAKEVSNRFKSY